MVGQTVSHYRIVEKLGGGGMGVVYRAEDERLKRAVAIKVLPPGLTRDRMAKERFEVEAQAASALDHPNICTIYEIDETPDGEMFLVMAFYPGETLKKKIERGPVKLDDALDYAIQIAQALKKAHENGIIHRDIKPANVLVTSDALVKVVDFGLAKLVSQSALTRTGTVLGTVSYMSPEQAIGHVADARSDLWSLGVVLHEMISGQLPFKGDSEMAIASAISHTTPPPLTSLRTGLPVELDRVVGRALAKRPDDRYQTAADMLSELRRLRRESDSQSSHQQTAAVAGSGATTQVLTQLPPQRRGWTGLVVAAAVAAVLGAGYWLLTRGGPVASLPELTNPVQVAGTIAVEGSPDWSPDGSMIAYGAADGVVEDIWVQPGGGPPINRTGDNLAPDRFPRWSPDGRQIAFWSIRPEGNGIYVMPALAGTARKVASHQSLSDTPPVWSQPNGAELGYPVDEAGVAYLELLNLRDFTKRRIVLEGRKGNARVDLAWSPDSKFLAYVDARNYTAQVSQLWILRLADGRATPLTDGRTNDWRPTWAPDSRTVYFTSNRGGAMDLWRRRISDDGSPVANAERLTTGLEVSEAALSPDGKRLAYAKGRWLANAWRVPVLPNRPATWADAQQLTFDQAHVEYLDISRDGQRLAISSDRSGNPDIWILPAAGVSAAGKEMHQFTTDPTPDWNPVWGPSDKDIAFYAYRSGNREIWIQAVAGGKASQLTQGDSESVFPRWSADGKSVIYNRRSGGAANLWTILVENGTPQPIPGGPASETYPDWSPVGDWIAFQSNRGEGTAIWRRPVTGGEPLPVSKGMDSRPRWTPDGRSVCFIRFELVPPAPVRNIWCAPVDTGAARRVTEFKGRRGIIDSNAFAIDSKFAYFAWRDDVGDVWIMDLVVKK